MKFNSIKVPRCYLTAILLAICLAVPGCGEGDGSSLATSSASASGPSPVAPSSLAATSSGTTFSPASEEPSAGPSPAPVETATPAPLEPASPVPSATLTPTPPAASPPQPSPTPALLVPGVQATLVVDEQVVAHDRAGLLLGMSFDGRTSMVRKQGGVSTPIGYYSNLDGSLLSEVGAAWSSQRPGTFRFPGNAYANYDFRRTIGPLGQRLPLTFQGQSGVLAFGFDEFVAMAGAMGVPSQDLQIMVTIYPGPTFSDPAALAADWVEYCNAPADGSNPRGGTDWAAVRAANGHPIPYGIRYWNVGNEPWTPGELNFDPAPYVTLATPIVQAMLAADPAIRITIPGVLPANPGPTPAARWNDGVLQAFAGQAWALSPHAFYPHTIPSSPPARGVATVEVALDRLIQRVQGTSWTLILGDHAHSIALNAQGAAAGDPDDAMSWQGALATTDCQLMLTGKPEVAMANFWIWGLSSAVWHPIKRAADGTVTLLAAGQAQALVAEVVQPRALAGNLNTSAVASDGNPYVLRARAFLSQDGQRLGVVAVNRDPQVDLAFDLAGLPSWSLQRARLLTAPSLLARTLNVTDLQGYGSSGAFPLPHESILLLEYTR